MDKGIQYNKGGGKMITQYFATQAQAWAFALDLDKDKYQVIDYGKMDSALPYYVSYACRM